MFVRKFHNGLKTGHFNESLTQKPILSLVEVVTRDKFYIKNEESNVDKKARDVKERVPNAKGSHHQRKSNYTSLIKDKTTFKRVVKASKSFTPLNTHHE